MRINYARKLFDFLIFIEGLLVFFYLSETLSNACMLTTGVFKLVQQLYPATEIGNVANAVSACADSLSGQNKGIVTKRA